jgi:hypothetical protein
VELAIQSPGTGLNHRPPLEVGARWISHPENIIAGRRVIRNWSGSNIFKHPIRRFSISEFIPVSEGFRATARLGAVQFGS